jgi:predicted RNase H-like nuclease (RuvC/YqgF family)
MMNKTENTLYILQNLSSTESKDLDYAEIDVYYEDEQGNEGAAQYDMPAIADDAISTINELEKRIEKLESYNNGLANESCEQQAKIRELEANQDRAEKLIFELHEQVYDSEYLDNQVKLYESLNAGIKQ